VVFGALGPVVAEARTDPAAELPRAVDDVVGGVVLEGLHERRAAVGDVVVGGPPPVVDHQLGVELAHLLE